MSRNYQNWYFDRGGQYLDSSSDAHEAFHDAVLEEADRARERAKYEEVADDSDTE